MITLSQRAFTSNYLLFAHFVDYCTQERGCMASNLGGAPKTGTMLVPDSPAVKRQKTTSGYNSTANNSPVDTGAYNSDNDSGDELFAGYVPDTPKHPGYETQPTQILPKPPVYETQPTQVLPKPYETQTTQVLPKKSYGYETQPTQIIDKSTNQQSSTPGTPDRVVQVPASSPFTGRDGITGQDESPLKRSRVGSPSKGVPQQQRLAPSMGGTNNPALDPRAQQYVDLMVSRPTVASSMAPAGTTYKPPHGIISRPPARPKGVIDLTDDDAGSRFQGGDSDSEDGSTNKANIKPSTFAPRSGGSFSGAPSTINGNSKFHEVMRKATYKAPATDMADGPRQPQLQTRPDRARPVEDITLDSMSDDKVRDNISRVRSILPHISILTARNALIQCKGNLNDAIDLLGQQIEISDDEQASSQTRQAPEMKRTLNGPAISIRDKYSSTQALPAKKVSQVQTPPAKPKRKLMQGRRNPSSPAIPVASSPLKPKSSPTVSIHDDFDSDSGVASATEEDPELEGRVLKYLNSCKVEELVELTNITKEIAEVMIKARPFQNLDVARAVENSKPLKSGKKSTRAPVGNRIVDTALEMFTGYEAIDHLVARCEDLGKAPAEEMGTWGFDVFGASKGGELELTSLEDDAESQRDSGIGSPNSRATSPKVNGDDDIRPVASTRKRSNINFLKKPDLMAEDCVLKDYQVVGLNWLAMMYRKELSCILADEMGLGKTCQVIAFLAHLIEKGHNGPHLVVCPGSTLENWLRECNRFAPQLMVEPYHGPMKERGEMAEQILANRDQINIVVTTYDMAARKDDNKFLRRLKPDVSLNSPISSYISNFFRFVYMMRAII